MESLKLVKRNNVEEAFKLDKLAKSIHLAMNSAGLTDPSYAAGVVDEVINEVLKSPEGLTTVKIAELVEKALVSKVVEDPRYELAARYYLLARIYNDVFGKGGWATFGPEDSKLSYYSLRVLASRYLTKNPTTGRFVETPRALFDRVAKHVSSVEGKEQGRWYSEFYRLLSELRFIPNSPTLMNAGTKLGILSACFVLPVRDSMVTPEGEGIYDTVRAQAIVFQQGGGTGFSFSELRPEGDVVSSTASVASGPLSFMRLFDINTDVVKQGGRRRGANMGVLHVWHPDIMKFIRSKSGELKDKALQNFNISVGMYDWFFKHMEEGRAVPLINPRKTSIDGSSDSRKYSIVWARHYMDEEWVQEAIIDELERRGGSVSLDESVIITWDEALAIAERENAIVGWEDPKALFQEIVKNAWESGDPGILFVDTINRRHPTWYVGKINATNPCVSSDTRILTSEGWLTAKEVFEKARLNGVAVGVTVNKEILGYGGEPVAYKTKVVTLRGGEAGFKATEGDGSEPGTPHVADAWVWHVGRKEALKVKTSEGFEITVTKEHRLLTSKGWKTAKELVQGDEILLPRIPLAYYEESVVDGIDLDGDVAFTLGWLVGNGTLNKRYVAWFFNGEAVAAEERVRKGIEKLGGDSSSYTRVLGKDGVQYGEDTAVYRNVVRLLGGELGEGRDKVLPELAWRLKPKGLAAFLNGLFMANGYVDDGEAIKLTSSSQSLLKSVQILLTTLGIVGRIYERPCKELRGNDVKERIGGNHYELAISGRGGESFKEILGLKGVGGLERLDLDESKRRYVGLTVDEVEEVGYADFYDFTVPEEHTYIANGLMNHNCGEEPLLEWESCNLGSINLERYVTYVNGRPAIDWVGLGVDVRIAVRFLDNVIDVAKWPLTQLERTTKHARKVGLGVMGWAHMLIRLGIPYDSVDALYLAYYLSEWIAYNAYKSSVELAKEKGPFPAWDPKLYRPFWTTSRTFNELMNTAGIEVKVSEAVKALVKERPSVDWNSLHEEMLKHGIRNATLLSIAPTGTISIIAGTSSSIEPVFALAFTRMVTVGTFTEVNNLFLESLRKYELDNPEVINLIAESGSIRRNPYIPKKLREVFVVAHDVEPVWHVLHQAVWQQWVDAGVSKTVNMRAEASVDDVRDVYMLAWRLGCKGITVYRDKSKSQQVIYFGAKLTRKIARERRMEGVSEATEAPRRGDESGREVKVSETLTEDEKKIQAKYRMTSRYALQEGDAGDCYTCGY